jgi:hypothetical protein
MVRSALLSWKLPPAFPQASVLQVANNKQSSTSTIRIHTLRQSPLQPVGQTSIIVSSRDEEETNWDEGKLRAQQSLQKPGQQSVLHMLESNIIITEMV